MIKSYSELSDKERHLLINFYQAHTKKLLTLNELEQQFNISVYHHGDGVLFYFDQDQILASCCVVLKEASILQSAYIHRLLVHQIHHDKLKTLIVRAAQLAKEKGATSIYLGTHDLEIFKSLCILPKYRSLELNLSTPTQQEALPLVRVTSDNAQDYLHIYQQSFYPIAHASSLSLEELLEQLPYELKFIAYHDDTAVGFVNFEISDGNGFFDMGLLPEFQNQKLGIKLLNSAISYLMDQKTTINLIVIEKNSRAYDLYRKHGFEIKKVMTYWTDVSY